MKSISLFSINTISWKHSLTVSCPWQHPFSPALFLRLSLDGSSQFILYLLWAIYPPLLSLQTEDFLPKVKDQSGNKLWKKTVTWPLRQTRTPRQSVVITKAACCSSVAQLCPTLCYLMEYFHITYAHPLICFKSSLNYSEYLIQCTYYVNSCKLNLSVLCACKASLSYKISWSLLKLMSIKSVMPSNNLTLCLPISFCSCLQSFPASVFSNESVLCIRWPKWCLCFLKRCPGLS